VLNKEEACLLVGHDEVEALLFKLKGLGPKIIAITDGKQTLYAMDEHHIYSASPPPVKIVDATGAGDAFAASFLSGILRKNDIEFAIRLGVANAQSVVKYFGAKNILLGYNEALRAANSLKMKVKKKKI
jgi:sugar/nucleoside kinase (ribokinase family)